MSNQTSLLYGLERHRVVELVGINEVAFVALAAEPQTGHIGSIGVRGLSACTVVILASRYGAVLAHIGPNNPGSTEEGSFIKLANRMMDRLFEEYQNHSQYFGANTKTWVVFAVIGGSVATPEQKEVFTTRIKQMGLPDPVQIPRPLQPPTSDDRPGGTVVVIGGAVSARLFVEDREMTNEGSHQLATTIAPYTSARAATATEPTAPTFTAPQFLGSVPVGTHWDGSHFVSTQNPAYVLINGDWAPRSSAAPYAYQATFQQQEAKERVDDDDEDEEDEVDAANE